VICTGLVACRYDTSQKRSGGMVLRPCRYGIYRPKPSYFARWIEDINHTAWMINVINIQTAGGDVCTAQSCYENSLLFWLTV